MAMFIAKQMVGSKMDAVKGNLRLFKVNQKTIGS